MNYVPYQGPNENFDVDQVPQYLGEGVDDVRQGLSRGGRDLEQGLLFGETTVLDPVDKFLSWRPWELFVHLAMVVIIIYAIYRMVYEKDARSVTNLLLLSVVLSICVQIHQNIDTKRLIKLDRM